MNKTITTVAALIAEPLLPAGEDTGRGNLSDNFGQSNCVILRESCKLQFSTNAVNAQIAASFRRNRANSRNIENGFESRWGAMPFHQLLRCSAFVSQGFKGRRGNQRAILYSIIGIAFPHY